MFSTAIDMVWRIRGTAAHTRFADPFGAITHLASQRRRGRETTYGYRVCPTHEARKSLPDGG